MPQNDVHHKGLEELQRKVYGETQDDEVRGAPNMRGRFLRTREVALLFGVSERAVTDWAKRGRIPCSRTPGGHRRYPADKIRELLIETGRIDPPVARAS